jgi:hypothetical protein
MIRCWWPNDFRNKSPFEIFANFGFFRALAGCGQLKGHNCVNDRDKRQVSCGFH